VSAQRRIHVRRPTRHLVRLRGRARVDLADPHARHARPGRRRRLPAPKGRAVGTARGAEGDIAGAAEVRRGREEEEAGRDPNGRRLAGIVGRDPRQKAGRLPHEDRAAEEAERGAQADDGAKGHRRAAAQSGPDAQDDA
jgi:hypothetical protein